MFLRQIIYNLLLMKLSEQVFRSLARMLSEATVGPEAAEMKQDALKLKKADETAVAEGGSSDSNIQSSADEAKRSEAKKSSVRWQVH
ncbi:hypothetical protein POTOM_033170 [Populus tomentosa]|uniref:Uncharacterized protein n=1 Tax=Populus tomentosa TaxID=118781 RepID=A0A8X7Z513_POPTO|nr:hypothetical protein POTOM_033170 [Populus tomentosa]